MSYSFGSSSNSRKGRKAHGSGDLEILTANGGGCGATSNNDWGSSSNSSNGSGNMSATSSPTSGASSSTSPSSAASSWHTRRKQYTMRARSYVLRLLVFMRASWRFVLPCAFLLFFLAWRMLMSRTWAPGTPWLVRRVEPKLHLYSPDALFGRAKSSSTTSRRGGVGGGGSGGRRAGAAASSSSSSSSLSSSGAAVLGSSCPTLRIYVASDEIPYNLRIGYWLAGPEGEGTKPGRPPLLTLAPAAACAEVGGDASRLHPTVLSSGHILSCDARAVAASLFAHGAGTDPLETPRFRPSPGAAVGAWGNSTVEEPLPRAAMEAADALASQLQEFREARVLALNAGTKWGTDILVYASFLSIPTQEEWELMEGKGPKPKPKDWRNWREDMYVDDLSLLAIAQIRAALGPTLGSFETAPFRVVRVSAPEDADVVFVPLTLKDDDVFEEPHCEFMGNHLTTHLPSIMERPNVHVFASPHTYRDYMQEKFAWCVRPFMVAYPFANATYLTVQAYPTNVTMARENFPSLGLVTGEGWPRLQMQVPFPGFLHLAGTRTAVETWRKYLSSTFANGEEARPVFLSYAGGPRTPGSYRNIAAEELLLCKECVSLDVSFDAAHQGPERKDQVSYNALLLYGVSSFCLQPPGDAPLRKAIVESLVMGCVPVAVMRGDSESAYLNPFEDTMGLDWTRLVVSVPWHIWTRKLLVPFLHSLDLSEWRRAMLAALPILHWSIPVDERTAFGEYAGGGGGAKKLKKGGVNGGRLEGEGEGGGGRNGHPEKEDDDDDDINNVFFFANGTSAPPPCLLHLQNPRTLLARTINGLVSLSSLSSSSSSSARGGVGEKDNEEEGPEGTCASEEWSWARKLRGDHEEDATTTHGASSYLFPSSASIKTSAAAASGHGSVCPPEGDVSSPLAPQAVFQGILWNMYGLATAVAEGVDAAAVFENNALEARRRARQDPHVAAAAAKFPL